MSDEGLSSPARPRNGRRRGTPRRARAAIGAALGILMLGASFVAIRPAAAAEPDLARSGTTTASASQNDKDGNFPAANATDGDAATRWASGNGPDSDTPFTATLSSDLGAVATVSSVTVAWENAYATGYDVQIASADPADEASWSTVHAETSGQGGTESVSFDEPVQARYVRLAMLTRVGFDWDPGTTHWYGYSVFSFEVRGTMAVPAVGFETSQLSTPAGSDVVVPVSLTNETDAEQTVRVTSADGSAAAGTDYTAVDETITFPAGVTRQTLSIPTVSRGALAPPTTFVLTLGAPSDGIALGTRSASTVTITPTGVLPNAGRTSVLEDFQGGVPADYSVWASSAPVVPVLQTVTDEAVPGAASGNSVLQAAVTGTPDASSYFGFTNDRAAADWSAYDGFQFWFLGTGSNKTLGYELKSDGRLFDESVVDDTTGWRQISALFSDLRLKGDKSSDARFAPSAATGFAVTLTGLGAGAYSFDDFAVFERAVTLEDFQGDVPIGSADDPTGFFTWGSPKSTVTLDVEAQERGDVADNRVLSGSFHIPEGGWGGFSDNLAAAQDWSSYQGIRFWWYASQSSNPASPTAGDDITVEIKDGGPDAEHSELWTATFKDNWGSSTNRWKLVELPFSSFALKGTQPGSGETLNQTLDLTSTWGFAQSFPAGKSAAVRYAVDDIQLYGTPAQGANLRVSATQDVYLVDQGDTAEVELAITTTTGAPLAAPVEVSYRSGKGTATPETHFTDFSGTVTFPAGTESGGTQAIRVATLSTSVGDEARSVPVVLEATGVQLPANAPRVVINAHDLPYLDSGRPTAQRVDDLLSRMSLSEKVGQMAQAERLGLTNPRQIAELGLGSVLSGGGSVPAGNTPEAWANMVDDYQRQALSTSLQVPLLYGADAVHGHSNVRDATIFPHNLGLGATRDADLVQDIAEATATETKTTGVNWTFAPCLCVGLDERWGRSYETFGEDPALVKMFAAANTEGLQGTDPAEMSGPHKVLATAKHWAGDGGTRYEPALAGTGYPIDQGVVHADSLEQFTAEHIDPYLPSLEAGVGSIMPSYSGLDLGDGAGVVRMHENRLLNTEVLKNQLGFRGFLISDWEGIDKLPGGSYAEKAIRSVNSGLDMAMAPYNFGAFITSIVDAVDGKAVSIDRVDDAVRRILTQKFALGLFEQPFSDRSAQGAFGSDVHRAVARDAAAQSQVLLKNDGVLPLAKDGSYYVAGSNADDLGNQMGGWTISWQGASGNGATRGTTILGGIEAAAPAASVTYSKDASAPFEEGQTGIVVVGEKPYSEGVGDVGNNGHSLSLTASDQAAIDTVCGAMSCVVLVVAGRTQLVTDKIDAVDGLIASFLPGSEGAGVSDVLFGDKPFTGRLPLSWPRSAEQLPINVGDASYDPLFSYGWGERTDSARSRLQTASAALPAGEARSAVDAAIAAPVWDGSGNVRDDEKAIAFVARAAYLLPGTDRGTLAAADLVVSVVRDLAQNAIVAGTNALLDDVSARTADAEHALLAGHALLAVQKLASVLGIAVTDTPGSPGGEVPGSPGSGHKALVSATLSVTQARPGDTVTATATGFVASEPLSGTIHSEPVPLGTSTATSAGIGSLTFTVPYGLDSGGHTVTLEGSGQIASASITLLGAGAGAGTATDPLAVTGLEVWLSVLLALALLAAGAILVPATGRRRG